MYPRNLFRKYTHVEIVDPKDPGSRWMVNTRTGLGSFFADLRRYGIGTAAFNLHCILTSKHNPQQVREDSLR